MAKVANTPINLDDARHLKRSGFPLNMQLEHRTLSQECSEHWLGLVKAHTRFVIAVNEYSDGPHAGAVGQWKLVKRRFGALIRAMNQCDAFVSKLSGNAVPPVFKSEQDEQEFNMLFFFIIDRAMPFAEFWRDAIDAVDAGTPVTISPRDIPKWFDEEAPSS